MSHAAFPDAAALAQFVCHEARLIDEKRFDEWYELFSDDGCYWIPLTRGQPPQETFTSISREDKLLLKVRIERLRHPHAYSQQQPSFCQHVLQQPLVESIDAQHNLCVLRTPYLYVETQLDTQIVLSGVAWHHLRMQGDALRIVLKKVELLNCDAALPAIQLFP
ncbi:MAG: nuclear transport factor 2 family protein [Proteobacteria bacterium]|nr:nuclear transport factor 2 family protein [Pseudomonadota bacterium]